MKKTLTTGMLALLIAGCAQVPTQDDQLTNLFSLRKEYFAGTTTLKDSALDTVATFSTVNGFQEKRGLLGIVWDDTFLRAFVDKKTGKVRYQVYQVLKYQDRSWRFYETVNVETESGPEVKRLAIIGRDVDCANSRYSGCTYSEHVGFDVDEAMIRKVASMYSPGQRTAWKFRFNSRSGNESDEGLVPAEVAGLLHRVDDFIPGAVSAVAATVRPVSAPKKNCELVKDEKGESKFVCP